jgi:hypothetical protein
MAVLAAVISTALVGVRLHMENARLRYRLADLERERLRLDRELRLASNELERARAPAELLRLRDERRAWEESQARVAATEEGR